VVHHQVITKEQENVKKIYIPWPDGVPNSKPKLVTKKYGIVKQRTVCDCILIHTWDWYTTGDVSYKDYPC